MDFSRSNVTIGSGVEAQGSSGQSEDMSDSATLSACLLWDLVTTPQVRVNNSSLAIASLPISKDTPGYRAVGYHRTGHRTHKNVTPDLDESKGIPARNLVNARRTIYSPV